jgi:hypothetical protein
MIRPVRVGGMMITSTYKNAPIHRILQLEKGTTKWKQRSQKKTSTSNKK